MPRLITLIEIGFCAGYGDGDYRINCEIADLPVDRFNELRSAMCSAIGTMEQMWRDEQGKKQIAQANRSAP